MTKIKLYVHTFYEKRYFMNGKGEILLDCEKRGEIFGNETYVILYSII